MANETPQQRTKPPEQYLFGLLKTYRRPMFLHERFERLVALILSCAIAVIIIISLIQVIRTIFMMLVVGALDPLDHTVFQSVFGMIMTLLIAMGFLHSVVRMAVRNDSLIQAKTLLLIGLLALTRKFIILSPSETEPDKIAALAGATLALGAVYWLLRERDDRLLALQSEEEKNRTETSV